jgi:hypothetical protein
MWRLVVRPQVEDDQIIVIAVMNAARDDSSFMHRLP